jgi:putative transposase
MRNSYHTTLKELVHYGLLPDKQLKQLPKSNRWRWENDNYNRFVGSEINDVALKFANEIKAVAQFPKMLHAYANLAKTLTKIIATSKDMSDSLRNDKEMIVEAVLKTQDLIPITKAVEVFNISRGTFNTWVIDVKHKCQKSYFNKCNRIYSNQIIPEEVMQIKKALTNPKTKHWPMRSIYLYGIKNGTISVSINTLYKVNQLLGIRDTKNRKRKKRHKKGIRANDPNKIWHADITIFKTIDGVKHYIYLVMDNYSRYIISYAIANKVCGIIRTKTIEEAYQSTLQYDENLNVDLIVDGGPENCNVHMNNLINRSDINMNKLIALKNITQSNSMVERANHTLKYRYLFLRDIRNKKHLLRTFNYFLKDYNIIKPHGELRTLTPFEAWSGKQVNDNHRMKLLTDAKSKRLEHNNANKCLKCELTRV